VNPLGLCVRNREIRAVGRAYKQLIKDWRQVLPTQSICLTVPVVTPQEHGHPIADRLRDEIDELVTTMLVRMRDEAPDFDTASRPELAGGLRGSCYGNIRTALDSLGDDRQPPRYCPTEAMDVARATARASIALEPLLHTYRIGHAVVLERFFDLIEELDLSERPRNCLKRARVDTIGQLVQKSEDDLLAITNFGSKSLEEVLQKLDERGLSLRVKE